MGFCWGLFVRASRGKVAVGSRHLPPILTGRWSSAHGFMRDLLPSLLDLQTGNPLLFS